MSSGIGKSPSARLDWLDVQRGLIMVVMALDHARGFISRDHPFEIWNAPLLQYESVLPFLTRFVTHFCAPGFFFLMGASFALFSDARRREGWTSAQVTRFLAKRGALLFVVQQFIENPAWIVGMLGATPKEMEAVAAAALPFTVLFGLAASMVLWSLLLTLPSAAIAALSAAAMVAGQAFLPAVDEPFSLLRNLLLTPGGSGFVFVVYPVLPWCGLAGLGIVFGRNVSRITPAQLAAAGLALLGCFVAIRVGDGFGNVHLPVQAGVIGFFNVTKYPPSLAFHCLTLGVTLCAASVLSSAVRGSEPWAAPLRTLGRAPLFFYLAHLYFYAIAGFAFPDGASLAVTYAIWPIGLIVLLPLTAAYGEFKNRQPMDSVWRFF